MAASVWRIGGFLAAALIALWLLWRLARTLWTIHQYGAGPWLRSTFTMDPDTGRLLGILFLLLAAVIAMRRWNGVDGQWFSFW